MIRSMTAYGAGRMETPEGTVNAEIRSVNNRYLDVTLRLPEDLRFAETRLRELLAQHVLRGKIELKLNYATTRNEPPSPFDLDALEVLAGQLRQARALIPDIVAPTLAELPREGSARSGLDTDLWLPRCEQACLGALAEFTAAREREGERLAQAMRVTAGSIDTLVDQIEEALPQLIEQYQERIAQRLRDALMAASPQGFAAISGEELSARIAQEAGLFGMRIDVAEELTRLRAHVQELHRLLETGRAATRNGNGKRLDFLFQEMNREANTLGSKSAALSVTQAAIDLKLLIEQMREQAQNIE